MATFPVTRLRRFRRTAALRSLVRETRLDPAEFVYPLFVCPGDGVEEPLEGLDGIARRSVDLLVEEAARVRGLGIGAVLLFGIPEEKDEVGSGAYDADGIIQRAVRTLKREAPELVLLTDVCLCEYTSHGHCGILDGGEVANDETLELLARTAVSHAEAGADAVAPSARWTIPSSSYAPEPASSLSSGIPKRRTAPIPSAWTRAASSAVRSTERRAIPARPSNGSSTPSPGQTKSG